MKFLEQHIALIRAHVAGLTERVSLSHRYDSLLTTLGLKTETASDDDPELHPDERAADEDVEIEVESAIEPDQELAKLTFARRQVLVVVMSDSLNDYKRQMRFGRIKRSIERLSTQFDSVELISPRSSSLADEINSENLRHLSLPRWFPLKRLAYQLVLPLLYRRRMADASAILVLGGSAGFAGRLVRLLAGCPMSVAPDHLIFTLPRPNSRFTSWIADLGVGSADYLVVDERDSAAHASQKRALESIHVIPGALDTDIFCPLDTTDPIGRPLLIYGGPLGPGTEYETFLTAMATVHSAFPELRAAMLASGVPRLGLEAEARSRGLPVSVAADVPPEALPTLLARAWAYVGAGDSVLEHRRLIEAMATGVPCVGPDLAPVIDEIECGRTGLLYDPGDADGLASTILRLRDQSGLRARLGRDARRHVRNNHSLHARCDQLAEILKHPEIPTQVSAESELVEGESLATEAAPQQNPDRVVRAADFDVGKEVDEAAKLAAMLEAIGVSGDQAETPAEPTSEVENDERIAA